MPKFTNLSTTVGTSQATILAGELPQGNASHNSKLLICNASATAEIMVGLAGETVSNSARTGIPLAGGQSIIFDLADSPIGNITAISDTTSTPLTIYTW